MAGCDVSVGRSIVSSELSKRPAAATDNFDSERAVVIDMPAKGISIDNITVSLYLFRNGDLCPGYSAFGDNSIGAHARGFSSDNQEHHADRSLSVSRYVLPVPVRTVGQ